jgi:putative SOS response-associated peptidase YedK
MAVRSAARITGIFHCRDAYRPSENASPGAKMPIIKLKHADEDEESTEVCSQLVVEPMQWGLVPSFTKQGSKPDFYRMFNARCETVRTKPIFSRLLKGRRCIVCVDGFYEWRQEHKVKQPYYVHLKDRPLLFAGAI